MSDMADFFRSRSDQMIELRHPLAVLASRLPWQELEANIAHLFAKKVHAGKDISDMDLFGGVAKVVGSGVSAAGRPRLPLRLIIPENVLYTWVGEFKKADEPLYNDLKVLQAEMVKLKAEIFDYIEVFCNRVRRHKHLDQLSPHAFARQRQTTL